MGRNVILTLEKVSELERILEVAKKRGVRPLIGMRAKLYARGSGKWAKSGGEAAKFGLTTTEMLAAIEILKAKRMLDCLVMLHFHIGSQITDIRKIKDAIREAGRVYAKLNRSGVEIRYLNLGGGLGVDYDGSKTSFDSSMNYTVQEYANDVVYNIKSICEDEKVPVPTLVTESGRAVTAYHSVLVSNVLDVADKIEQDKTVTLNGDENHVVRELYDVFKGVTAKNVRESYHDALQYKEELFTLFNLGYVSLEDRSKGEILFWDACDRIRRHLKGLKEIPEEFEDLERELADKYVLNFSVFQSVPDSWAIDQLFPILPIHRLREKPGEIATLADITCDSDGKIEKFIDLRDIKEFLPLHSFKRSQPYYLAVLPRRGLPGRPRRPPQPLRRGARGPRGGRRGEPDADPRPPPGRDVRAGPLLHELREGRDPRGHLEAAPQGGRQGHGPRGRGEVDRQGLRGRALALHLPRGVGRRPPRARGAAALAAPAAPAYASSAVETLTPPYLLLAAPILSDPNFEKTVVLMGHHSEEGAVGWIVNRLVDGGAKALLPEEVARTIHPDTPAADRRPGRHARPHRRPPRDDRRDRVDRHGARPRRLGDARRSCRASSPRYPTAGRSAASSSSATPAGARASSSTRWRRAPGSSSPTTPPSPSPPTSPASGNGPSPSSASAPSASRRPPAA